MASLFGELRCDAIADWKKFVYNIGMGILETMAFKTTSKLHVNKPPA